jgi:hypothetical protein
MTEMSLLKAYSHFDSWSQLIDLRNICRKSNLIRFMPPSADSLTREHVFYPYVCLSLNLSIRLSAHLSVYQFIRTYKYKFFCPFVNLPICLSFYQSIPLSYYLNVSISVPVSVSTSV